MEDSIATLSNDNEWHGGWYQAIEFPDGTRTRSTKYSDEVFYGNDSFGVKKWDKVIAPNLPGGKRFLEIGCNAGLYLVMAKEHGFEEIYGLDSSEYFLKQCRFVLGKFDVKATIFCADAVDFDYSQIPNLDVILMANALYWAVYSDEEGFKEDADKGMKTFLQRLSEKTKWLLTIGAEGIQRPGGTLEYTIPFLQESFDIIKREIVSLNDRTLNIIVCKTLKP